MLDDRNDTPSARQMTGLGVWDHTSNETGWTALLGAEGVAGLYTDDTVCIVPDGHYEGRAAIQSWLEESAEGFSDFKMNTSMLFEEEDPVMAEWTLQLTHVTGQNVELRGATVATVTDGKLRLTTTISTGSSRAA